MFSWFRRKRPQPAGPLAVEHVGVLRRNVWQHRWLPEELRQRLHRVVARMLEGRRWEGGGDLAVTDEMRVTVAGAAALLTIGYDEPYAFGRLPSVLLHPEQFTNPQEGDRLGEAWHRGPIVLSWADTLRSARRRCDGHNLVIHEFAHHLDGLSGEMDGRPAFEEEDRRRWSVVATREHDRLIARRGRREPTLLDPYGATNRAEFFAVASECFFERPHELKAEHAELFGLLAVFYRQDPTEWAPPPHRLAARRDAARWAPWEIDVGGLGMSPADEAFIKGQHAWGEGRLDEAVAEFDRALSLGPPDAEVLTHRAGVRIDLSDYTGALADARAAIDLDPRVALAHAAAAETLVELGDDRSAEPHAREAVRLDKEGLDGLLLCGSIALRAGRVREAIGYLKRAVWNDQAWDRAHYELACALEADGQTTKAAWHFERAEWLAAAPEE